MSTDYVDAVLQPDEVVTFRGKISWTVYIPYVVIGGAVSQGPIRDVFINPDESIMLQNPHLGVAFSSIFILSFAIPYLVRKLTIIATTNKRVILKFGVVFRRSLEMNMDKVESVEVEQSVFGRIFNSGAVVIHGTGGGKRRFRNIDSPLSFRNHIIAK